jgi:hypothetical protein
MHSSSPIAFLAYAASSKRTHGFILLLRGVIAVEIFGLRDPDAILVGSSNFTAIVAPTYRRLPLGFFVRRGRIATGVYLGDTEND